MNETSKIELQNWLAPIIVNLFKVHILRTFKTETTSLAIYSEGYLLGRQFTIADEFIDNEELAPSFELPEAEKIRTIEASSFAFGKRSNEEFYKEAYVDPTMEFDGDPKVFIHFVNGFIEGREYTLDEIGMKDDDEIGDKKFYAFAKRYGIEF